jgi:hypothetical protein
MHQMSSCESSVGDQQSTAKTTISTIQSEDVAHSISTATAQAQSDLQEVLRLKNPSPQCLIPLCSFISVTPCPLLKCPRAQPRPLQKARSRRAACEDAPAPHDRVPTKAPPYYSSSSRAGAAELGCLVHYHCSSEANAEAFAKVIKGSPAKGAIRGKRKPRPRLRDSVHETIFPRF